MAKSSGGGKSYRSAGSGRFVTKNYPGRAPEKTLAETRGGGSTGGTHRSAISGKFVKPSTAARHPGTTIKDG